MAPSSVNARRRPAAVLSVLLLAALPLAGCLAGTGPDGGPDGGGLDVYVPSEPRFDVLPVEEVWVPSTADGKGLHHAVYRPDVPDGTRVPVFINFSPYWGDTAEEGGDAFARYMVEEYVPRGFAVVLAAVRGTGHSEGCFQIGSDLELQDLHDVVAHFADAAWSNGRVAAGGKSYDSTSQNGMVAKVPHPALKGIFHVSGISDMYRYTYRHGVPYGHGATFNTYYYGQTWHEYGLPLPIASGAGGESDLSDDDAESLARVIDDAACAELPEMQVSGVGSAVHGMKTDYWVERDWNRVVGGSEWNGSVFFVHGLQDWNVKPDHILPWLEQLPDDVRVKGWLHQDTDNNGHVYPMRADWNQTMLAWLDHVLKDMPSGVHDGPAFEAEGSDGVWRASEAWPPKDADPAAIELGPDDFSAAEVAPFRTALTATVLEAGDAPVRIAGAPNITVHANVDNGDPVLTAVLYDVAPNGSRTWIDEAVLRGVLGHDLEGPPVPVLPGFTYAAPLEFYPLDHVLAPGHRLEVVLGATPRYAEPTPAQLTDVDYVPEATVGLPLAPMDTALADQPAPVPCFAC